MRQKIMCHQGRCFEEEEEDSSTVFESVFGEENVVKKIEKDLWKDMLYGE